ncbi:hypothetical protein FBEOM_6438 [Fusarium beomiforme]|uniref:Uncharacterized protein n=1 Tax=Fusarium beomiforme TaxID=44412 RepID=A0A9P5DY18_9HYPO|nr:hypothetical protein FBEOM_6438 [Fusarium beomiforme]
MLAATRIWTSERLVQSRTGTANILRSTVSLQSRCEQCRHFSPAVSTSSEYRHGRRRGSARFQQPATLNRNISWDTKSKAFKKASKGCHQSADPAKFATIDQVKTWANDLFGIRPGSNIEDVERSAIEHLFRGDTKANIRKATLTNAHHFSPASASTATSKETLFSAVHGQDATYIDPITNRRVSKSTNAGTAAQYEDQRSYKPSDFVEMYAVDSKPKYDDLDKYKPIIDIETKQPDQPKYDDLDKYKPKIDERPAEEKPVQYDDLDKYGPVKHNEPDGKRPPTAEEDSKNYKDLDKYATKNLDDPLAKRQLTAEEQSKVYDDLDLYKPVYYNEPDGKRPQTAEELSKTYDDLHKYEAVYWNEPDGLREPTPEERSKDYKDLHLYGSVQWNEPDGLRHLTPEEESKQHEDLDQYAEPFEASQSVLKAHEKAQMDRTMRGKPVAPKVDAPVEDFASKYDDLHKYGPYHWNEPDGLRKPTPEELSKNYDDLHLYGGPFQWNEPDGLRTLTPEEKSKSYKDVHMYAARDLSPPVDRVHPEEASKAYKDLPDYRNFANADDPTPRIHPEVASKKYADLGAYAFADSDPQTEHVHPELASKEYKDLHKYPSAGFEEIIEAQRVHPEELSKNYTDLGNYRRSDFVSQAQAFPVQPEDASKVFQDLHKYTNVRQTEPIGKMSVPLDEVARGLREFDSKAGSQDSPDATSRTYSRSSNRSSPNSTETSTDHSGPESVEAIRAAVLRRAHESSQKDKNQDLPGKKGQQVKTHDALKGSKLTGNYARDFPEEFGARWSTAFSPSKSSLFPNTHSESSPAKEVSSSIEDDVEPGSMDESFPIDDTKLQPSLDRYADRMKDLYSHKPQGLQTHYTQEIGAPTMPVSEKHFPPKEPRAETEKPKVAAYKIVAYDPASRVMSVAEANSAVGVSDSPTSIPDALIKLGDPTKFLPYIKSFQDQGYQVVSGSGRMLIFRKMQSGDETASQGGSSSTDSITRIWHDSHHERCHQSSTRRSSNFKTKKSAKKGSIGRKVLVGTGVVAGSAYAAALLAKSLSTKSSDVKLQS